MGQITSNPTVSLQANIGAPILFYLADGAPIFGCIGNPEGVIPANKRALAISDNGNVYIKTTNTVATGWSALGGGGSGTVTSIGLGGNAIFDFSGSSANPITTAGTFDIDFATQTANKVFASPSSGGAAIPAFRKLVAADLALAAAPPANGVQYNDGTNAFTASNGFKFDPATNTVQAGESTVLKGTFQLFAALSAGSVKHTVNNPGGNYVWIWGDSLPANNDLLKVTVSGSNVTIASIAASALGFASVNPTSGVLPYNNAGVFADSPITRASATSLISTANLQLPNGSTGSGNVPLNLGDTDTGFFRNVSGQWTYTTAGASLVTLSGIGVRIGSNNQYHFTNTTLSTGTQDAGIARLAAGVLRITNSSTGAGQLGVGTSTMTTANQFSVDSQSTTRIAGFYSMPNGSSVATIQGVTNSIQSFAFNPSGKLIGGMNIPTTNQQFSALGNAKSDVSSIGNVGTGIDNLLSFVIQANVLNNTGDYAEFDAFGEFENNANNKNLSIKLGTTTIFTTGALPFGVAALANWRINAKILRTGASAQKCIVTFWCTDATTPFLQTYTTSGESLTSNLTVQFTGEATTNNDITQEHLESKLVVALTS